MYGFKVWMKMSAVSLPVLVVRTGFSNKYYVN